MIERINYAFQLFVVKLLVTLCIKFPRLNRDSHGVHFDFFPFSSNLYFFGGVYANNLNCKKLSVYHIIMICCSYIH